MYNGGPTQTDALLSDLNGDINISGVSVAIGAGNNSLLPGNPAPLPASPPISTDQRGPGFPRVQNTLSVGAFEYEQPLISNLNPNTIGAGSAAFTLVITGTGFVSSSTVTFGNDTITPTAGDITSTQITVEIPAKDVQSPATVNVTVNNPDGSGIAGQDVSSLPQPFKITSEATGLTLTNPGTQNNSENQNVSLPIFSSNPSGNDFTSTTLPPGLSINASTGVVTGTIGTYAANGSPYTVTVNDTNGSATASTMFTWNVAETSPPSFTNPGSQTSKDGQSISLATDPVEADAGTIMATGLPSGLTIDHTTGLITGTIAAGADGGSPYSVVVSGSRGANSASISFQWTVNASTSTLVSPGSQTNNFGDSINLQVQDPGADAGSFKSTTLPPGLSISTSGLITGTLTSLAGSPYSVTVSDTESGIAQSATFTWTVNQTLVSPGNQSSSVGTAISPLTISDPKANGGSFKSTTLPPGLSISTAGVITGTITSNAGSPYNVTVSDTEGSSNVSVNFTWTVAAASTLQSPGNQSGTVGTAITGLQIVDSKADAGSFKSTTLPPGLSISTSGLITGTPTSAGTFPNVTVSDTESGTPESVSFSWTVAAASGSTLVSPGNQSSTVGTAITALQIADPKADANSFSSGTLPPGLSISKSGLITGTPTTAGSFTTAIDDTEGGTSESVSFTWTVTAASGTTLVSPGNQSSTVGTAITALQIADTKADAGSFKSTTLPPGLSISTSGLITGTPTTAGTFPTVTVSDTESGTPESVSFSWTVAAASGTTLVSPGNQSSTVGTAITALQIADTKADAGSFKSTTLPPGLSISTSGLITGTPTTAGTFPTVTVSDTESGTPESVSFSWTVAAASGSTLVSPGTQSGSTVGIAITGLQIADPKADANSFSSSTLPPGLSISTSGLITGTPTTSGTFTTTVNDTEGGTPESVTFTWSVTAASSGSTLVNPGTQSSSTVGTAISVLSIVDPKADAGSFKSTTLPPGLSITNTGLIFGTPTTAGTFTTTVSDTESGTPASVTFTWVVNPSSSGGGGGSSGSSSPSSVVGATTVSIASIQNSYPLGMFQIETITVNVTGPNGAPVNEGVVHFAVDGVTLSASVQNGTASATLVNPFLDFLILPELFFPHGLDAVYSDPNGVFGNSSASSMEPAILFDFVFSFLNAEVNFLTHGLV